MASRVLLCCQQPELARITWILSPVTSPHPAVSSPMTQNAGRDLSGGESRWES